MELEDTRNYLQPLTTEETSLPDAKEVIDKVFMIKDDNQIAKGIDLHRRNCCNFNFCNRWLCWD